MNANERAATRYLAEDPDRACRTLGWESLARRLAEDVLSLLDALDVERAALAVVREAEAS